MMNLHILSDPVTDFWKCSKEGFKNDVLTFLGSLIGSTKTQLWVHGHMGIGTYGYRNIWV